MDLRTRGYLPHIELSNATYFLTFRLQDSLPYQQLLHWKQELETQKRVHVSDPNGLLRLERAYWTKIQNYLDTNAGMCWLKHPSVANMVANTLRFFDRQRYVLHVWTIMPNHVHVLVTLGNEFNMAAVFHSWKSYSAHRANDLLKLRGQFWQPEYFDRLIKSERHFHYTVRYILNNPVKAGLCKEFYQWPWSGWSMELDPILRRYWL